ncbi:hypothetical protein Glove_242g156 [Diversispora epigaea]|uniref:Uncharacterized protein n=1 Tax=Diversispora epigaea TaxID=1348612 RepID=A0A397ICA9_9GLOM|nr:hypothetical protein Glove_242g156 [Diversispora epigaea]
MSSFSTVILVSDTLCLTYCDLGTLDLLGIFDILGLGQLLAFFYKHSIMSYHKYRDNPSTNSFHKFGSKWSFQVTTAFRLLLCVFVPEEQKTLGITNKLARSVLKVLSRFLHQDNNPSLQNGIGTRRVIFYISASNWNVVFARIRTKIKYLSTTNDEWPETAELKN